jgi:RNA polymerase sigma-70 factor (ECF subfamily)
MHHCLFQNALVKYVREQTSSAVTGQGSEAESLSRQREKLHHGPSFASPARNAGKVLERCQIRTSRDYNREKPPNGSPDGPVSGGVIIAKIPGEVTVLLAEPKLGRKAALARLLPLVYKELRRLAGHYLRDERIGHTLQPTALVHEAYLRLVGQERANWQNRAPFMGVAAQLTRRILVDYARESAAAKSGGGAVRIYGEGFHLGASAEQSEQVLAVDEALARLSKLDPQQAQIVEMRSFGALTVEEAAEALGVSPRTIKRGWAMAKAWQRSELSEGRLQ